MIGSILVVIASLACGTTTRPDEPLQWPQYGGAARNFITAKVTVTADAAPVIWRRPLGEGTSGIVSDGRSLFTMYSVPDNPKADNGVEVVVAIDAANGKTLWDFRSPVERLKGQESYSNDPVRPQSTPAIWKNRVCTLGYAGALRCFDSVSGKQVWQHDLVTEFGATPVQFGFSASPLIYRDQFIVHVGGKKATLIAFKADTGEAVWQSAPAEPSYASPVVITIGNEDQIVQVTRDAVVSVAAKSGENRWSYSMPEAGLTNVPTPIVLPNNQILMSSQGMHGSQLLKITGKGGSCKAEAVWSNTRAQFFYCNWMVDGATAYGNASSFLVAIDLATGKELWRERGYGESNQLRAGDETIILHGDGKLTRCRLTPKGIEVKASFQALNSRCWAPPTLVGDTLYVRDTKEIAAIRTGAIR